jgi:glycerol uptake facilitator-like aquaporin
VAQYFGAFCGSFLVYVTYYERIVSHEAAHLQRKLSNPNLLAVPASNLTFQMSNTGHIFVTRKFADSLITCFWDQFFVTSLLMGLVLAIVDRNNYNMPEWAQPISLGFMVYTLVGCFALNAGAALNPARDFGPRVMMVICGWGLEVLTDNDYYFWVPIVAPHLGAILGAFGYDLLVGNHLVPLPSAVETSSIKYVHTPSKGGYGNMVPTSPAKQVLAEKEKHPVDVEMAKLNVKEGTDEVCIHLIKRDGEEPKQPRDSIVADMEA